MPVNDDTKTAPTTKRAEAAAMRRNTRSRLVTSCHMVLEPIVHPRREMREIELALIRKHAKPAYVGTNRQATPHPDVQTATHGEHQTGFGPIDVGKGKDDR